MWWMLMVALAKEPGLEIVVEEEEKCREQPLLQESSNNASQRPLLGVYENNEALTDILKEQLGITHGWIVGALTKGGPAEKAGLKPRDILLSIDGRKVMDFSDVQAAVRVRKPGDKITLEILRGGKTQNLDVVLGSSLETRNEVRVLRMSPDHCDDSLTPEQKFNWLKNRYQLEIIPDNLDGDLGRMREMLRNRIDDLGPEEGPDTGDARPRVLVTRMFADSSPEGTVIVTETNGVPKISIRTQSGETLLNNGTAEEAAKLPEPWPEKVRLLLEKMK